MDEQLSAICSKLNDLIGLYKLVNSGTIEAAKNRLLANSNRRKVYESCDGGTGVTEISRQIGISQPAVSGHVAALAEAGLLGKTTNDGRIFYRRRLED